MADDIKLNDVAPTLETTEPALPEAPASEPGDELPATPALPVEAAKDLEGKDEAGTAEPVVPAADAIPGEVSGDLEKPVEAAEEPADPTKLADSLPAGIEATPTPADETPAEPLTAGTTTAGTDGASGASGASGSSLPAPLDEEDTKVDEPAPSEPLALEAKPPEPAAEEEPKAPTFGDVKGDVVDLNDHLPGETLSSLREAGCELFMFLADMSEVDTTLLGQETSARLANVRDKAQLLLSAIESVFIRHG